MKCYIPAAIFLAGNDGDPPSTDSVDASDKLSVFRYYIKANLLQLNGKITKYNKEWSFGKLFIILSFKHIFKYRIIICYRSHCSEQYFELRDGATENSPLIGRFCNNPTSYKVSTGNILRVKFFTDLATPVDGFIARVSLSMLPLFLMRIHFFLFKTPSSHSPHDNFVRFLLNSIA